MAGAVPKPSINTIHGRTRILGNPYTAPTNGCSVSWSERTEPITMPPVTPSTAAST